MREHTKMRDQQQAFEFIERQDWTNNYKANARYRWRLRHAPNTIKKRKPKKECVICCNEYTIDNFTENIDLCCHYGMLCKTCCKKVHKCPYCRKKWSPAPRSPSIIVFNVPISLEIIFNGIDQESSDVMREIISRLSQQIT